MRLGVLDVGSNSVKLQVVDAGGGRAPLPVSAYKASVKLAERRQADGEIGRDAVQRLIAAIAEAKAVADQQDVEELICFATEAIRAAPNEEFVCRQVRSSTGVDLRVLSGEEEARLGFLAARRWFGWSAGPLLVLDLGGGSMQVSMGAAEEPDLAVSLPVGVGALSRRLRKHDPMSSEERAAVRHEVEEALSDTVDRLGWAGRAESAAGLSKTFEQLARLTGAPPRSKGVFVDRHLDRAQLRPLIKQMASMPERQVAQLRGVSTDRASQIVAGAIIAETVMSALAIDRLHICPWAVRAGVMLRRVDGLRNDDAREEERVVEAAQQRRGARQPLKRS